MQNKEVGELEDVKLVIVSAYIALRIMKEWNLLRLRLIASYNLLPLSLLLSCKWQRSMGNPLCRSVIQFGIIFFVSDS